MTDKYLNYKKTWLCIGYMLIAIVVYQTLTANPVSVGVKVSDKLLHVMGYFVLMGWFVQIYHKKLHKFLWALFFVMMGITMEFLQGWSGVRFFEVNDMIANALGVFLAWGLSATKFSECILVFEKYVLKTNS
jgi:VanZ family protein